MTTNVSCKFCASRCGMVIHHNENKITRVKGNTAHPVSRGWTCARGRAATAKYYKEIFKD